MTPREMRRRAATCLEEASRTVDPDRSTDLKVLAAQLRLSADEIEEARRDAWREDDA
jgi:hypothetical protein